MSGPLIPYIEAPEIPLGFLQHLPLLGDLIDPRDPPSIKPFGTLVAIGVYVGSWITMSRARERGLDEKKLSDFIFWVVASGFVISHIFDALTYHPQTVARDPLYLLRIWDGLSSYGGFMGAVIGAFAWRFYRRESIMELVDVTVSAFPAAWVFGRSGCTVVHDHPGRLSNAWFAVKYPPHTLMEGYDGRFDLGLIEMVLTIPLAIACAVLWRRRPLRPNGFYVALTLVAYAPVRFFLDFLRVEPGDIVFGGAVDHRYGGLTPAQWACFVALAVGLLFLYRIRGAEYVPTGPRAPVEVDDEENEAASGDDADEDEDEDEDEDPPRRRRRPRRAREAAGPTDVGDDAPPPKKKKKQKKRRRPEKKTDAGESAD